MELPESAWGEDNFLKLNPLSPRPEVHFEGASRPKAYLGYKGVIVEHGEDPIPNPPGVRSPPSVVEVEV